MKKLDVFGVPVSVGATLDDVERVLREALSQKRSCLCSFVNPHAVSLVKSKGDYFSSLRSMDYVLCDGIGMAVGVGLACGVKTQRISFDATSLSPVVFSLCLDLGISLYLIGGKPGVAEQAASVFKRKYPALKVVGTASGYGDDVARAKVDILERDNVVVIAGLGAPKQEEFLIDLKSAGWSGVGFTCGGYFDQVGDCDSYYPKWVDRFNLRFAYRLACEPRRLWRRYVFEYSDFLKAFFGALLKRMVGGGS